MDKEHNSMLIIIDVQYFVLEIQSKFHYVAEIESFSNCSNFSIFHPLPVPNFQISCFVLLVVRESIRPSIHCYVSISVYLSGSVAHWMQLVTISPISKCNFSYRLMVHLVLIIPCTGYWRIRFYAYRSSGNAVHGAHYLWRILRAGD